MSRIFAARDSQFGVRRPGKAHLVRALLLIGRPRKGLGRVQVVQVHQPWTGEGQGQAARREGQARKRNQMWKMERKEEGAQAGPNALVSRSGWLRGGEIHLEHGRAVVAA